jgi:hypothetical protein
MGGGGGGGGGTWCFFRIHRQTVKQFKKHYVVRVGVPCVPIFCKECIDNVFSRLIDERFECFLA